MTMSRSEQVSIVDEIVCGDRSREAELVEAYYLPPNEAIDCDFVHLTGDCGMVRVPTRGFGEVEVAYMEKRRAKTDLHPGRRHADMARLNREAAESGLRLLEGMERTLPKQALSPVAQDVLDTFRAITNDYKPLGRRKDVA